MSDFTLEVGKQYLNKNGQKITIQSAITDTGSDKYQQGYRFFDTKGFVYTESGAWRIGKPSMLDIDQALPGKDWFQRNADLSDFLSLVRTDPKAFANACAGAIMDGTLVFKGNPDDNPAT